MEGFPFKWTNSELLAFLGPEYVEAYKKHLSGDKSARNPLHSPDTGIEDWGVMSGAIVKRKGEWLVREPDYTEFNDKLRAVNALRDRKEEAEKSTRTLDKDGALHTMES